jgi:hypothetical protein
VVAPLIGKAPPEIPIWISGGQAPAFVREEGPLYQGGPVLTIQLTSPAWPDLVLSRVGSPLQSIPTLAACSFKF